MKDLAIILWNHFRIARRHGLRFWLANYRQGLRNRADQIRGYWPV